MRQIAARAVFGAGVKSTMLAIACTCVAGTCVAGPSTPANLPPGTEWAAWINRVVEVNLQDLPKVYGCDDLWYKVRDILLAIGAREYLSITPYHCGKNAANGGRSPSVEMGFQTLRQVTGKEIYWANTRAVPTTVDLTPGHPQRLDATDCALVEQIGESLFPYLGLKVDKSRFQCEGQPSAHDFDVSVHVLQRWPNTVEGRPGGAQR